MKVFDIPQFSVNVEYRLRQGNLLYLRDTTHLKVTKKHNILEKLAEAMYAFKAYPTKEDFESVAIALVQTIDVTCKNNGRSVRDVTHRILQRPNEAQ